MFKYYIHLLLNYDYYYILFTELFSRELEYVWVKLNRTLKEIDVEFYGLFSRQHGCQPNPAIFLWWDRNLNKNGIIPYK